MYAPDMPSEPLPSGDALDCGYMIEEDSLHDVLLHVMRTTSRESSWSIESSGAFAEQQQCRPSGDTSPQASSAEIRAASPVGLPLDEVRRAVPCTKTTLYKDHSLKIL
jgi:hypothetical protein